MLTGTTMIPHRSRSGDFFLIAIALFVTSACSESGQKSVKCQRLAVLAAGGLTALDHEVDYKAFNSTFLNPEVAKLYGIDQDKSLGVVMVSVYQADAPGVSVEACVSGGATNLIGQAKRLDFEQIREGEAIYHISTFRFSQEEHITFEVDVEIAATGEVHKLKDGRRRVRVDVNRDHDVSVLFSGDGMCRHQIRWKQQFWRG